MKGIPFSHEMALALLEGRKSETRRVIKHPLLTKENEFDEFDGSGTIEDGSFVWHTVPKSGSRICVKPKYNVGDVCFVQEAFTTYHKNTPEEDAAKLAAVKRGFKSLDDLIAWSELPTGGGQVQVLYKSDFGDWADDPDSDLGPWKSPRFMPAWAARTFVEIRSVRVERVGEITEEGCKAEGISCCYWAEDDWIDSDGYPATGEARASRAVEDYAELWNRLHPKAPYRFEDDPFCWAYGLKEVPRP